MDYLSLGTGRGVWWWFRAWALIRLTGKWPAPAWGSSKFPMVLDYCACCGAQNITVLHPLLDCSANASSYATLLWKWGLPQRADRSNAVFALFGHTSDLERLGEVIHFVGTSIAPCISRLILHDADTSHDPINIDRTDAMPRQADRDFGGDQADLDQSWDDIVTL